MAIQTDQVPINRRQTLKGPLLMAASLPTAHFKELVCVVQYSQIRTVRGGKLHKRSIRGKGTLGGRSTQTPQRPCYVIWYRRTDLPLQLLSSQGKTQFWMPLHTSDVLMHMLLWQKNVLPAQGAGKQAQMHYPRQTLWPQQCSCFSN